MPSVRELNLCAANHLTHYVDPASGRAFYTYDRIGNPDNLEPADILAPALLDAPVPGRDVIKMYLRTGTHAELRKALESVLRDRDAAVARFVDQDIDSDIGAWALVEAALRASDEAPGFRAAKVTKILHRKRPALVPIFDSKVAEFYGVSVRRPWELWPLLQVELRHHGEWLRELSESYRTPDERPVADLRVLDIVVWEHMQGCDQGE